MKKLQRFSENKTARWVLGLLVPLLLLGSALSALERLRLEEGFYASAVPGDPVRMGMRPWEVRGALGTPDDTWAVRDFFQVGLAGNDFEMAPTGEVVLRYWRPVLGQKARFDYSHYQGKNRVEDLTVNLGSYATLAEAMDAAGEVLEYAHAAFAQKGGYTFEQRDSVTAAASWRFRAQRGEEVFTLGVAVLDHSGLGLFGEPYSVTLYQHLYR